MINSKIDDAERAAFAFLESMGIESRLPLDLDHLIAEGRAWKVAGRYTLAENFFRAAVQLARSRSQPEVIGDASLCLVETLIGLSRASEAASVLRSLVGLPLSPRLAILWDSFMGYLLLESCRHDLSEKYCRRALDVPADEVPADRLGMARNARGAILCSLGHYEAAQREFLAARRILERIDNPGLNVAFTLSNEVVVHLWRGDADRAVDRVEEIRTFGFSGNPQLCAVLDVFHAEAAIMTGDLELARCLDEQAELALIRAGREGVKADIVIHRAVMDEDDPAVRISELDATAQGFYIQGEFDKSSRLWSMAAIVAGREGLPAEPYQRRAHSLAADRAPLMDTHHARLFDAARRPRPGRLRVRWTTAGPALHLASGVTLDRYGEVRFDDLEAAVFTAEPELGALVRKPLWGLRRLLTFDDWREFERAAPSMGVAVVVLPSVADENDRRLLIAFKARAPFLPVVLVTRRDADGSLDGLQVEEVVWFGEVERKLRDATLRAASRAFLPWLALMLSRADRLPVKLREALVYACRTSSPVRSVSSLAEAVRRHRTTLGRMWRQTVGDATIRLEDFLDWLLLLRAVGRRPRGLSWAAVAAELAVPEQTLRETSRRLAGRRLDELADAAGQAWLVERFARQVLDPLLGAQRINSR